MGVGLAGALEALLIRAVSLLFAVRSLLAVTAPAQPAPPLGHFRGAMIREGARLPISLEFSRTAAGVYATWTAPDLRALGAPLQRVVVCEIVLVQSIPRVIEHRLVEITGDDLDGGGKSLRQVTRHDTVPAAISSTRDGRRPATRRDRSAA